jgi:hypothetical protein
MAGKPGEIRTWNLPNSSLISEAGVINTKLGAGLMYRCVTLVKIRVQSTDNELIPARNASLVAMKGSVTGSNVRYYPT